MTIKFPRVIVSVKRHKWLKKKALWESRSIAEVAEEIFSKSAKK